MYSYGEIPPVTEPTKLMGSPISPKYGPPASAIGGPAPPKITSPQVATLVGVSLG